MKVVNTELQDLPEIFRWFDASVAYQQQRGYPDWANYDQDAVRKNIEEKNSFKVVNENDVGIVFSVSYNDPVIWREMDDGESIYLHRIVVNPDFKGKRLLGIIVDWALQQNKKYIRMDTWADNPTIIEYYKSFGFEVVENYTTPDSEELPVHNRKLALTLLQLNRSHR
jgi:GNAT superfamily N-acetyltransferase